MKYNSWQSSTATNNLQEVLIGVSQETKLICIFTDLPQASVPQKEEEEEKKK